METLRVCERASTSLAEKTKPMWFLQLIERPKQLEWLATKHLWTTSQDKTRICLHKSKLRWQMCKYQTSPVCWAWIKGVERSRENQNSVQPTPQFGWLWSQRKDSFWKWWPSCWVALSLHVVELHWTIKSFTHHEHPNNPRYWSSPFQSAVQFTSN